jgi:5'-methylthioadenosine phosphorylase
MVTDYDCWHPHHGDVSVELVIRQVHENTAAARRVLAELAADFPQEREDCPAGSHRALDFAIITAPDARDPDLMRKLDAVAGRVLGG